MPWKVKKVNSEYCVFDKNNKKMKCYSDKSKAEDYKSALYANAQENLENIQHLMLENGPVVVGIAATNIPHLPLPPMSVVEDGGEKKLRVPFLRSGIFRHPQGELVFNKKIFNKILENHDSNKSWYGVSLNEKHKPGAALAWFDKDRGGEIRQENDPKYGNMLVAYGKPTSQRALEMIENQEYVFASVELQPNHSSNMIAKLSMDDMNEITLEELARTEDICLEDKMEDVTITLEEYQELKEKADKAEKIVELEDALEQEKTKVVELEEKLNEVDGDETPELPEDVKILMENQSKEIARLKKSALETQVNLVIAKAENYRDENGRGHSPVLLEIARSAMMGVPVSVSEEDTIKLESSNPSDVADYFRKVFIHMLETVPGQVQLESKTKEEDERSFEKGSTFSDDDYKSFWADSL